MGFSGFGLGGGAQLLGLQDGATTEGGRILAVTPIEGGIEGGNLAVDVGGGLTEGGGGQQDILRWGLSDFVLPQEERPQPEQCFGGKDDGGRQDDGLLEVGGQVLGFGGRGGVQVVGGAVLGTGSVQGGGGVKQGGVGSGQGIGNVVGGSVVGGGSVVVGGGSV